MSPQAQEALDELLAAAERRTDRGDAPDGATFPFTEERLASYYRCSAAELGVVHADLGVAARDGAITIDWDPDSGERGRILRLRAANAAKLAAIVGRPPRWDTLAIAERALAPWALHPRVERLLAAWSKGKSGRSKGPESWPDWRDALRVIDNLPVAVSRETPLRRLSTALFANSKRIEKLVPCLDYLTAAGEDDLQRDASDLFAELGLPRYPQPILVASFQSALRLVGGTIVPPAHPYIGLPPEQLAGFDHPVEYVLTIENLASFNEAARQRRPTVSAALIYTAGMPGPRFLAAYRRLLQTVGLGARILHWGDMDLGGLRIAAKLATVANGEGFALQLHDFIRPAGDAEGRKELTSREKSSMVSLCDQFGWAAEKVFVEGASWAREQEEDVPHMPWAV